MANVAALELVRQIRARKRIASEYMHYNGHLQRKKTWSLTEEDAAELLLEGYTQGAEALNSRKWDAEHDAQDQRERIAMLDRWIEKQEAAVKRWWEEARNQRGTSPHRRTG